jgi:hypothetical protein
LAISDWRLVTASSTEINKRESQTNVILSARMLRAKDLEVVSQIRFEGARLQPRRE